MPTAPAWIPIGIQSMNIHSRFDKARWKKLPLYDPPAPTGVAVHAVSVVKKIQGPCETLDTCETWLGVFLECLNHSFETEARHLVFLIIEYGRSLN